VSAGDDFTSLTLRELALLLKGLEATPRGRVHLEALREIHREYYQGHSTITFIREFVGASWFAVLGETNPQGAAYFAVRRLLTKLRQEADDNALAAIMRSLEPRAPLPTPSGSDAPDVEPRWLRTLTGEPPKLARYQAYDDNFTRARPEQIKAAVAEIRRKAPGELRANIRRWGRPILRWRFKADTTTDEIERYRF
jgi:hypothetical protein